MKTINRILLLSFHMLSYNSDAVSQESPYNYLTKTIEPYHISIGLNKTSNLIFPYPVKSVDRGSADILIQTAKGTENVLQLKAAKEGFAQTNLSIITSDAKFYSFIVDYAKDPSPLNIAFYTYDINRNTPNALLKGVEINADSLHKLSREIMIQKPFMRKIIREQKIQLVLNGVYIANNVMWIALKISNYSSIDYKIDQVRFLVRDRKKAKRTASQEIEIKPLYVAADKAIEGKRSAKLIFAFNPFTISTNKKLIIKITEPAGGRSLQLPLSYQTMINARFVNLKE